VSLLLRFYTDRFVRLICQIVEIVELCELFDPDSYRERNFLFAKLVTT